MGNRHRHHHRKFKGGGVNYTDNKSAVPEEADENAHAKAKKRKPVVGVEGAKAKHNLGKRGRRMPRYDAGGPVATIASGFNHVG